jgi:hypothetical protein
VQFSSITVSQTEEAPRVAGRRLPKTERSGLSHLFYPWGLILQVIAIVHFVKRRPENYWLWIILIGGPIGAGAYLLVEVLPDTRLLPGVFQGFGRRSRIQNLQNQILDNPSAGNYEELGDLHLEEKNYQKARDAYNKALESYGARKASGSGTDMKHVYYGRGRSLLGLGDYASAIPDLERIACSDVKFDFYRASGLLADAYARTGDLTRAEQWFVPATQYSTTPEVLYNYAWFLKTQNRTEEAREWLDKLMQKKRTLPGYRQRAERPWFRKGKALRKEIEAKK